MLTFQNYKRPQTLEEAWTLNQSKSARLAAGMMWMRMGDAQIGTVVDLCGLGLDHLEETQDAFLIGAMVPLRKCSCATPRPSAAASGGALASRT